MWIFGSVVPFQLLHGVNQTWRKAIIHHFSRPEWSEPFNPPTFCVGKNSPTKAVKIHPKVVIWDFQGPLTHIIPHNWLSQWLTFKLLGITYFIGKMKLSRIRKRKTDMVHLKMDPLEEVIRNLKNTWVYHFIEALSSILCLVKDPALQSGGMKKKHVLLQENSMELERSTILAWSCRGACVATCQSAGWLWGTKQWTAKKNRWGETGKRWAPVTRL